MERWGLCFYCFALSSGLTGVVGEVKMEREEKKRGEKAWSV